MAVTAIIDISTTTGRRLVLELEKYTKIVELIYPEPVKEADELPDDLITWEEAEEYLWDKLEEHYGVDLHTL